MPELLTLARPYAKAIFNYALAKNQLNNWAMLLHTLDIVIKQKNVINFIDNPATNMQQHVDLLLSPLTIVIDHELSALTNFIKILAKNKRLLLLSSINFLFIAMRSLYEQHLLVKVVSAIEITVEQQKLLKEKLTQKFTRQIELEIIIDKLLLGGAIIYVDDLVIDGSVREKLNKLKTVLVRKF